MSCRAAAIAGVLGFAWLAAAQAPPAPVADVLYQRAVASAKARQWNQADTLLRAALRRRPDHADSYRLLWAIHNERGIGDDPAQAARLAEQFPEGWYLQQTDHHLILYDAAHPWAQTRTRLLQTATKKFYDQLRADGFMPTPPRQRMVAILFSQHDDFLQYARRVDRLNHAWSGGYYSSRTNRVAMFNYHTSPLLEELLTKMRKTGSDVERWAGEAANNPAMRGPLARAQRDYANAKRRYEVAASYGNIRQTLHEAAHQLAHNSGIQRPGRTYPMWFSEGLACAFESMNPAVPFGPTQPNPSRQYELREALKQSHVDALPDFVARTIPPEHQAQRLGAYAQSWALFHFLYNHHLPRLRDYVRYMATQPPGERDADTLRADFARHFGDPAKLQPAFMDHVRKITR